MKKYNELKKLSSLIFYTRLIKKYKLNNKNIAIECNGEIIPKIRYKKIFKNNDKLEIVHFIGGG